MADGSNWPAPRKGGNGGTPPFIPTQEMQHMVMVMRSNGDSVQVIARAIHVSPKTVRRHFQAELKNGFDDVKSRVQAAVVRSALGGNVAAQKFWLCRYVPEWRIARDSARDADDMPPTTETVNFYMPENGRDKPDPDDEPPTIEGTVAAA